MPSKLGPPIEDVHRTTVSDLFILKNKVSVVIGASGGLGAAFARGLADSGSKVALVGRNRSKLDSIETEITTSGGSAISYPLDITKKSEAEDGGKKIHRKFGSIDILVNAQGTNLRVATEEFPLHEWKKVIMTNLQGTFLACQVFGGYMIKAMRGKIINISSTAAITGYKWGYSAYSPSKAGVDALTRTLAVEWAKYNINVNSIAPYFVETKLTANFLSNRAIRDEILETIPLGYFGKPSDIVGAVIFFASPASDWITGQTIYIDGGYTAR